MVELERRCAVMNENYANDMSIKLKQINLSEDEKYFHKTFLCTPITPPPMISAMGNPSTIMAPPPASASYAVAGVPLSPPPMRVGTPVGSLNIPSGSNHAIDYHIPRTASMPPSYDSQEVTREDLTVGATQDMFYAATTEHLYAAANVYHSRVPTQPLSMELPSQP